MKSVDAVLKFGGDALRDATGIVNCARVAAEAIKKNEGRVAIVVSAMRGVTDELLAIVRRSSTNRYFGSFRARHFAVARELGVTGSLFPVLRELNGALPLIRKPQDVGVQTECAEVEDLAVSFGERCAAPLLAAAINKELGAETARAVDARELIVASNLFNEVKVDFIETEQKFAQFFADFQGVPVITGFIGATREGKVITLGRNGSDYSAAIVVQMLHTKTLELWKTVDGVMTADPNLVPQARLVPALSFEEMHEISGCGAKVVDKRVMLLIEKAGAEIRVRNVNNLGSEGTRISCEGRVCGNPVTCIVTVPNLGAVDVEGIGLADEPGMLERAAGAMRRRAKSIKFVGQTVSESAIGFALKETDIADAFDALAAEFDHEIGRGSIRIVRRGEKLAALAIIGDRMRGVCGLVARITGALARASINIVACSQAANEADVSIVVAESDLKAAVNAVHREFFADGAVGVFIVGLGSVGTEFAKKLARAHVSGTKLVGVANSKKWHVDLKGINGEEAKQLLLASDKPFSVDALIEASRNFKQVVVVDATSSREIVNRYADMAQAGLHIVRANKKLSELDMESYNHFGRAREKYKIEERKSASVGAGQPILYAVRRIKDGNDVVTHMDMILSGTNNFVLDEPAPMRENLRKAEELGFAEPRKNRDEPSADLTGEDVRLKVVEILRTMGWWMEPAKVLVEDMNKYPDEDITERKRLARERGCVLKYVATVDVQVISVQVTVRLLEVRETDPLASVHGACNGAVIYTRTYHHNPIVIIGQGAGVEQTAQALLADVVDVVRVIGVRR